MGLISLPIMLRYGYDRRLARRCDCRLWHSGTDHSPSLVLIIIADQLGRSVGDMYKGRLPAWSDAHRFYAQLRHLLAI